MKIDKNLYVKDIIEKCHGQLIQGNLETPLNEFSKDTRTLNAGDVYIGIKGESLDGNNFYLDALKKGAIGCILNDSVHINYKELEEYPNVFIVLVQDTILCLQNLASLKRSYYDIPVIGVTGSVGKTSTKDIIFSVLSKKYKILKTEGNYNNHIGLPLTILKLKEHNALVVEMGMSHSNEISILSKIARPNIGVITTIGSAHIGNLGSRENILKAKLEILDGLDQNGLLIINNDNDLLHDWYLKNKNKYLIKTFGVNNPSDYNAINLKTNVLSSSYDILLDNTLQHFKINIPGEHFILNSLCAIAVGEFYKIPIEDIQNGIKNFNLTKKRMEVEKINGITLINDCYNASLDSMISALKYLGNLKNTRKIALLGDMLELGEFSEKLHREVGKAVYNNKVDILVTVGSNAKYIYDECLKLGFNKKNLYAYDNKEDALNVIKYLLQKNDTILIKASSLMYFGEIYNKIKEVIKLK